MPPAPKIDYRQDIDGLRAIAVLAVLVFHLDVPGFAGGFVGVDIFFVISGYLITRIIRDEVALTGTIEFRRFYLRRSRRLLPAMFTALVASAIAAAVILPPVALTSFAGSLAAAVVSASNFWFWNEAGYFDTSAHVKPLLHTWSLAVEEQFYLIWPVTLLVVLRFKTPLVWIAGIGVASLAANVLVVHDFDLGIFADGRATIFFWAPFRVFEFAIGAALVWAGTSRSKPTSEALVAAGLLAIAYTVFTFDADTVFPSLNGLIPCVGAALLIYAAPRSYLALVFNNRLAAGIGLGSYSLYLVHWPLIVFYRQITGRPLDSLDRVWLVVACAALTLALYYGIEQRFRRPRSSSSMKFVAATAGIGVVLFAGAVQANVSKGWIWRYSPQIAALLQDNLWMGFTPRLPACFMMPYMTEADIAPSCYTIDPSSKKPNIILYGDSTAEHYDIGLRQLIGKDVNIFLWSGSNCTVVYEFNSPINPNCGRLNKIFLEEVLPKNRYDLVIISSALRFPLNTEKLTATIARLKELGIPYLVLGQIITWKDRPQNLVARHGRVGGLPEFMKANLTLGCTDEYGLDSAAPRRFFSVKARMCADGIPVFERSGKLLQADGLHLSQAGSLFVAEALAPWLMDDLRKRGD